MLSSARPLETRKRWSCFLATSKREPQCCHHKNERWRVEKSLLHFCKVILSSFMCSSLLFSVFFCVKKLLFAFPVLNVFFTYNKRRVSTCANHHSSYHISSLYIMVAETIDNCCCCCYTYTVYLLTLVAEKGGFRIIKSRSNTKEWWQTWNKVSDAKKNKKKKRKEKCLKRFQTRWTVVVDVVFLLFRCEEKFL